MDAPHSSLTDLLLGPVGPGQGGWDSGQKPAVVLVTDPGWRDQQGVEVDHHIHHTLAASSSQRGLFFARVTFSVDECPAGAWGDPLQSHRYGYGHQLGPFPLTNAGQIEMLVRCELEHVTADPSNPAFHPLSSSGRRHLSLQMFPKTCL